MNAKATIPVLVYYRYMGLADDRGGSKRYFCGSCRRDIGGVYGGACCGFPKYPEDLEATNESDHGLGSWEPERGGLEYYSFCPWCGAEFVDEWWKDRTIQNERTIDHYRNPGSHKGDMHEFRGSGPNCMAGHVLGSSDPTTVCWCEPEIEPGIMGCVIRHHQDKSYEDYVALQREMQDDEAAADGEWDE